jgi:predicted ATP-grasp superfamily ATP-dependent carboligase
VASAARQNGTPRVLVTDGEQRCALAACRALAAAGYEVGAASARQPAAAKWSRYCSHGIGVPDPRRHPARFADRLRSELERRRYDVVLPAGDASLLALSSHRESLEPLVLMGLPAHPVVEACFDKELLVKRAQETGFAPPVTTRCQTLDEGRRAAGRLGYPVIVKPPRSFCAARGSERKPVIAANDGALAAAAERVGTPFLVQEFLGDAPIVSCSGVAAEGRLLGFVTSRYERVWPHARGSASCSETFAPPAALHARIGRLVASLGWSGIFEIELIERPGGAPAVIDFNTRVYGSLALAVRAGSNLPAIWCRYLLHQELIDGRPENGLRYRWEDGELLSLLRALARRELGTAAAIVRAGHDVVWAHYEPRDAAPLVARLIYLGRRGIETAARPPARAAAGACGRGRSPSPARRRRPGARGRARPAPERSVSNASSGGQS